MISEQLQDLLDIVFGSPNLPSESELLPLAHFGDAYPSEVLVQVIRLMWLERNDLEAFNKWVLENL